MCLKPKKLYLESKLLFKVQDFMMILATLIQNLFPTGTHIFLIGNVESGKKNKIKKTNKNTLDLKSEA